MSGNGIPGKYEYEYSQDLLRLSCRYAELMPQNWCKTTGKIDNRQNQINRGYGGGSSTSIGIHLHIQCTPFIADLEDPTPDYRREEPIKH